MDELNVVKEENRKLEQKIVEKSNFDIIKKQYDKASKRLIILDYDGTLVRFFRDPLQAYPTPELMEILTELSNDPKNHIIISSGRNRFILDEWLGSLPVGLAAEHGAFYKENGKWNENIRKIEWDKEILDILKHAVKRTPGSRIEVKDTALVWHYRDVDPWLAELRINQLVNALINPLSRRNLQLMKGNKILEIKSPDFSKGMEALRLLKEYSYDFVMAIGDDTTDEDMFAALPQETITIKVGKSSKNAVYNIPTQSQTLSFLDRLAK